MICLIYEIKLKDMRLRSKLTLRSLAALTGISKSELNSIEVGDKVPRVSTIVILSKFFDCDLSDLIKF